MCIPNLNGLFTAALRQKERSLAFNGVICVTLFGSQINDSVAIAKDRVEQHLKSLKFIDQCFLAKGQT